jgi:EmrB/QacA subfamily drug resistance transporter
MDYKKTTLLVTTLGAFLVPIMSSSFNIALPSIGKEFAMDAVLLGWVTISFLLSSAIFLVPFGRIADIHGRKKTFLFGFLIYTITSLFCAIATSPAFLIFFRVLNGIGASMTFTTGPAILISIYPPGERGTVLGINVAAVYSGLSCGPFIGGLLTYHFGWRSIFLMNGALGLLITLVTLWKLKGEWTEAKGEKFDVTGAILFSFTLVAIMYGFSQLPGLMGFGSVLLGALGVILFMKWEARAESPIVNMNLFRKNKVFAFSNLAALINYSATFAVSFLMSLYLQLVKGLNPEEAGLVLVSQPLVQAIFSPLAGKLSDRMEPRMIASVGMGLTALGLFLFTFLDQGTSTLFIISSLLLLGFGFGLFSSPNTNAVMSSVENKFYGVASATLGTMRSTGMMFSMGMVMMIFAIYVGQTQITLSPSSLFLKSMKVAFSIFTGLCIAGIFASLSRGRVR